LGFGVVPVMDRASADYQILFFRSDGELSVRSTMPAGGASDATSQAQRLLSSKIPKAEIWYGDSLVNTVYSGDGIILPWKKKLA
jgi:hypothetical protein